MDTRDIMRIALKLSGIDDVPSDSGVFAPAGDIRRVWVGIDLCEADLEAAKAQGCDLALTHHPIRAGAILGVLPRHEDLMLRAGVPADRAKEACRLTIAPHRKATDRAMTDDRAGRLTALARELSIGLMNIHTPCDEIGRAELQRLADGLPDGAHLSDLLTVYRGIPEMAESSESVELCLGSPGSPAGEVVVIHGAGTNGGYHVARALFDSGVDTVVYIHLSARNRERLVAEQGGSIVLTGHYASDSLGINPLLDALEDEGIELSCHRHMIRVSRGR